MKKPITHALSHCQWPWEAYLKRAFHGLLLLVFTLTSALANAQTGCTMACNNLVNVSLPAVCEAEINYDMVLEGTYSTCNPNGPGAFSVEVSYQGVPIPTSPVVTAANIGQTLTATVTHIASGNSCWGSIVVEDKLAPQLDCPADVTVACTADTTPVNTGYALATDCSNFSLAYSNSTQGFGCGGPYAATLTRTWTAFDIYGNWSQCTQLINIALPQTGDVQFPPNYDNIEEPALDCENPNTDPSNTGEPSINGQPIPGNGGGYCNMAVTHSDQTIQLCENSFKILRNWVVVSWCTGQITSDIQIIAVMDSKAPTVQCPPAMEVGTNSSQTCTASFFLPSANITDNCSSTFTVSMNTPVGVVYGNGGLLSNVPTGNHTITFNVTDDCGNSASCQTGLTVVDASPPTVVCDAYTVVTLNNNGVALVFAQTFDDGSYDNCSSVVTFEVRRMQAACGTQPVFGPTVKFCCADVGDDVQVEMKVTDYNGNSNSCMVVVHVDDSTPPIVQCPADVTIACTDDYNDLALTGEPVVTEACGIDTLYYTQNVDLNLCNIGTVTRTWTANDPNGNTNSCTHTITLEDFTAPVIEFPPNYAVTSCTSPGQLHPDSLPAPYNGPVISSDCELMAVNYTDQVFTVAPPACFKIVRTWKVINWCTYQPGGSTGIWEATQIIMVTDDTPPTFTCPDDMQVSVDTNCVATVVLPGVSDVQDCSDDINIEVLTNLGFGAGPFTGVAPGSYGATYIVSDGCGNSSSCAIDITVVDDKKPTPYCKNGLTIEIMNSLPPMVEVWASDFDVASFDNCSTNLQFSFSPDTDSTSMVLNCDDIGQIPVQMWVTDEAGNQDYCETFLILQDNMGACSGPLVASVGGAVINEDGYSVQDVMVTVNDSINNMAMTGPDGNFQFDSLMTGFDYTVTPSKDTNIVNGVTTFDLVLIRKHVLNEQMLDSPYKIIAADANNSASVTTADMVALQKVILHEVDTLPSNKSWRFVDAAYDFPDPANPWLEEFPEVYNINDLDGNMDSVNFLAIKIGDVNGSAAPNEFWDPVDERTGETLVLKTDNRRLRPGELARIPITSENFEEIIGFQFTLRFDPNALEMVELEPGVLPNLSEANFGFSLIDEGVITASWNDTKAQYLDPEEVLFTLVVRPVSAQALEEALAISSDYTVAEAYFESGDLLDVELEFSEGEEIESSLSAVVAPNPFVEQTAIGFFNPEKQEVTLRIFNTAGDLVYERSRMAFKGYDRFLLGPSDLSVAGTFIYQLITSDDAVSGKLVKTR